MFLFSALASYGAIRSEHRVALSRGFERLADACFLVGLVSLTALSVLFAYELV